MIDIIKLIKYTTLDDLFLKYPHDRFKEKIKRILIRIK